MNIVARCACCGDPRVWAKSLLTGPREYVSIVCGACGNLFNRRVGESEMEFLVRWNDQASRCAIPNSDCPFCEIVRNRKAGGVRDGDVLTINPRAPYTPGHRLVIPSEHIVVGSASSPGILGKLLLRAYQELAGQPGNILVSQGEQATQSIKHIHVHVIPRGESDGLGKDWPWMRPDRV